MCGRYVFALRPSEVRRQLNESNMPSEDAPGDDECRQTYNFAPGNIGAVYRAISPDSSAGSHTKHAEHEVETADTTVPVIKVTEVGVSSQETKYKLQAMKWGLIPFWTKRNPDYSSMMRTINCRDDSLIEDRGMWTTMKKKKRCIVVCQGFYEWLKKNNGKEKIPHYVKRKDGQLMCFAGLWDRVKYEGSEEKTYTYTIITTNPNKQLKFLHDRMPVLLDNGSEAIRTWLDPNRTEWTKELQSLCKPYEGELEVYPVSKEVGKVGNNSPSFIVPINSAENKQNIANFFGAQKKTPKIKEETKENVKTKTGVKTEDANVKQELDETRVTTDLETTEGNAPLPGPPGSGLNKGIKREHDDAAGDATAETVDGAPAVKSRKTLIFIEPESVKSPTKSLIKSPVKPASGRKMRSATSNGTVAKSPAKGNGSQKITAFFGK